MKIFGLKKWIPGLAWIVFSALAVLALLLAMLPPVRVDSLVYHLVIPKFYMESGGMHEMPWNIYSYFPCLMELIYWVCLTCGISSPQVAHAVVGLGCCGLTALLAKRLALPIAYRWMAVFAVLLTPEFFKEMTWAYVDLLNVFFWTLGFLLFLRWEEQRKPGLLLWMGAAAAGACCVKYTSLIFTLILGLFVLLCLRKDNRKEQRMQVFGLVGFGVVLLLLTSWWWVRNWIWTGNPLFPFFGSVFSSTNPHWPAEQTQQFLAFVNQYGGAGQQGIVGRILGAPLLFFTLIPSLGARFDGAFNLWLLAAFVSLVWVRKVPVLRWVWGLVLIKWVFWVFSSQQVRFALEMVPFLAVAAAFAVYQVRQRAPRKALGLVLLFVGIALLNGILLGRYYLNHHTVEAVVSADTESYLKARLPYWDVYEYIHRNTPDDAMIGMVMTGAQTYYLQRSYQTDTVFEERTLGAMIRQSASAEDVIYAMRQAGWDYLLVYAPVACDPVWIDPAYHSILRDLFQNRLVLVYHANGYVLYDLSKMKQKQMIQL